MIAFILLGAIGLVALFGVAALISATRKEWAKERAIRARRVARAIRAEENQRARAQLAAERAQRQPAPVVGLTDVFDKLEHSVRFARQPEPMAAAPVPPRRAANGSTPPPIRPTAAPAPIRPGVPPPIPSRPVRATRTMPPPLPRSRR